MVCLTLFACVHVVCLYQYRPICFIKTLQTLHRIMHSNATNYILNMQWTQWNEITTTCYAVHTYYDIELDIIIHWLTRNNEVQTEIGARFCVHEPPSYLVTKWYLIYCHFVHNKRLYFDWFMIKWKHSIAHLLYSPIYVQHRSNDLIHYEVALF